jgi:hypothetical protein
VSWPGRVSPRASVSPISSLEVGGPQRCWQGALTTRSPSAGFGGCATQPALRGAPEYWYETSGQTLENPREPVGPAVPSCRVLGGGDIWVFLEAEECVVSKPERMFGGRPCVARARRRKVLAGLDRAQAVPKA